jgi:hypothetical protein
VDIVVLKADHAALTAVLTAASVVCVYACWRAAARAAYAAFWAPLKVVIAVSSVASRAATAAPTHAIFVVTDSAVTVVGGIPVEPVVSAKAGTATAKVARAVITASDFLNILFKWLFL